MQKHAVTGSVQDQRKNRTPTLHTTEHADFVNGKIEENPDLSASKLNDLIQAEFGINVSVSTVRVYRRKLGWVASKTRYCQMIRHVNKDKRKDWCEEQLQSNEQFDVSMSLYLRMSMYFWDKLYTCMSYTVFMHSTMFEAIFVKDLEYCKSI